MEEELKKIEQEISNVEKKLKKLKDKEHELKHIEEIEFMKSAVGKYFSIKYEGGGTYRIFKCTGYNEKDFTLIGTYISAQYYLIGTFTFSFSNNEFFCADDFKKEFKEIPKEKYEEIKHDLLKNIEKK